MNSWPEFLLVAACIVIIILPPKYDPAIKLKEFNVWWADKIAKRRMK